MDYEQELTEVKKELLDVETQIEELLERQNQLHQKKKEIERILKDNSQKESTSKQALNDKQWDSTDFSWSKDLHIKMKEVFGIDHLRPMQLQTMNVTLSSKDCMLIMPTGGGKSLCFQLPALLSKGITLVVSPLISLMEDQVMALENLQIEAALLNASSDKDYVKRIQEAMIDKKSRLHLLYVTPEKLAKSKRFMGKLEKMYQVGRFSRLVIDEVHCCSQWGHDFRPDYKFLGIMKRQFPSVPILGLTATATLKVLDDVKKILNIPHSILFKASFNRPNLYYEVKQKPATQKATLDELVGLINCRFRGQSGIIYCFSQKETFEIAKELITRGIKAGSYHGSMSADERSRVHKAWISNTIQVVVATVAFGMGIDKPDVRFVIHHSLSKSMENLYQESGRAGRDDKESHCIVYYKLADIFRQSTMVFTEQTGLENLYGIIAYCIDLSKCRRSVIARHFGEVWERAQCNEMCDHCDSKKQFSVQKRDITKSCRDIIVILNEASRTDQRVTGAKLIDAWLGKGQASLKVKSIATPPFTVEACERIVAFMIVEGYLKEDFHFTPYSTISYLVPGPKSRMLNIDSHQVMVNFKQKKKSSISSPDGLQKLSKNPSAVKISSSETHKEAKEDRKSNYSMATAGVKDKSFNGRKSSHSKEETCVKKSNSSQDRSKIHTQKLSLNSVKPKLAVVAKNENSGLMSDERTKDGENSEIRPNKTKAKLSLGKRRRVLISDSEDDDIMDLDFGDKNEFEPKALKIRCKNTSPSTASSCSNTNVILDACEPVGAHNSSLDESIVTVIDDSD